MNIHGYIGILAGILGLISFYPLLRSMKRGVTKPDLAGWMLFALSTIMIVASSIALGAWQAVWLAIALVVGQLCIIIVSLQTGYVSFTTFDRSCLIISFLGLLLWVMTNDPLYALVLNVLVNALGTLAIAHKLYDHPGTEDVIAWTSFLFVAILNVFAVQTFDIIHALYPLYLLAANALIVTLSIRRV